MINKSIEEKNFMIAKFMGGQQNELNKQNNSIFLSHIDDSVVQYLDDLKYHDSISWQLQVLKRIENMGFIVELFLVLGGCCKIMKAGFKSPFVSFGNFTNEIEESIFEAISETIEYINQTKDIDDMASIRRSSLYNLGCKFNGESYSYEDTNISKTISEDEIANMDSENWSLLCSEIGNSKRKTQKEWNKNKLAEQLNGQLLGASLNVIKDTSYNGGIATIANGHKVKQLEKIAFRISNGYKLKETQDELSKP